jgi:CRISPR-associated protein Cst2
MNKHRNLFATVLTHVAPSSNYRGESEENRTVIQKITIGKHEHAVISPESMRNALREILIQYGLPSNRSRIHDADQLAVEFKDFPDASRYADDFLFGFMVADAKEMKKQKLPGKRDSVLRMNMAVALTPYRFDATFHQSPLNATHSGDKPKWRNASTSALLHREVSATAFQYPFALAGADVAEGKGAEWASELLRAIGELSNVAGGHARSLYEMAPRSIVARLTPSLVAGYDTYGFDEQGRFGPLARISSDDLPGDEFWVGGEVVRAMSADERARLQAAGVHLHDNPQRLLAALAEVAYKKG